jgi:hypothetical protein
MWFESAPAFLCTLNTVYITQRSCDLLAVHCSLTLENTEPQACKTSYTHEGA